MQNSIVSLLGSHLRKLWVRSTAAAKSPLAPDYDDTDNRIWTNIYRTPGNSLLFRNVLGEEGEQEEKKPKPEWRGPTALSRVRIGEALGAKLEVVRKTAKDLVSLADPQTAHFVNEALSSLDQQ